MPISEKKIEEGQRKFGLHIKSIRENKGLSQLDLATRCNFEKTTLSRIENGRTNVTLKTAMILAHALEVELFSLFEFN